MPPRSLPLRRKILYGAVVTFLFFVFLESGLWLVGFEAPSRVETMAFTFPIDDYNSSSPVPFLERDPELFWKPRPGILGHNSQSCLGPEFATQKPDGVYRIVCLGDSCTHFGPLSYPALWQAQLDRIAPGRFEVINAGVIGYTSYQGMTLLRTKVRTWQPDLITVYFGWNDHWLARDFADRDQSARLPAMLQLRNAADHLRTVQLAACFKAAFLAPGRPGMRVELSDYGDNLRTMHTLTREIGCNVWYLTAPQALDLGIPSFLVTSGEVADPRTLVQLHQQYTAVVRDVAQETSSPLIDVEREMDRHLKQALFVDDHIHLTDDGKAFVVRMLMDELHRAGKVASTNAGEIPDTDSPNPSRKERE